MRSCDVGNREYFQCIDHSMNNVSVMFLLFFTIIYRVKISPEDWRALCDLPVIYFKHGPC